MGSGSEEFGSPEGKGTILISQKNTDILNRCVHKHGLHVRMRSLAAGATKNRDQRRGRWSWSGTFVDQDWATLSLAGSITAVVDYYLGK